MAENGKAIREWIGTVGTVITIVTALGISLAKVGPWVIETIPRLSWLIAGLTVPWLALLIGGTAFAWGFFRLGRRIEARAAVDPRSQAKTSTFKPDEVQEEVIRAMRYFDRAMFEDEIAQAVRAMNKEVSSRELHLGLMELHRQRWVSGAQRWRGGGYQLVLELEDRGMEYAKAKGFSHGRST